MVEGGLAATLRPDCRGRAFGVRGRDGSQRLALLPLRLVASRRAGASEGAALASLGQERHPALASITAGGLGPCLAVEGPTTREVFETYLERVLAPALRPGQVVVLDNLSAHKGGRVKEIVEGAGCELLYLPPYSPDLNPIEQAFRGGQGADAQSRGAHPRGTRRGDGTGAGRGHGL
jgi:hypothetical protein